MQNSALERKTFTIQLVLPKKRWLGDYIEYIEIKQATVGQTMEYLRRKSEGIDEISMIILAMEKSRGTPFSKKQKNHLLANGEELLAIRYSTYLHGIYPEKTLSASNEIGDNRSPEGSFFVFLAKEIATPIPVILNEMTWEQIWELSIGLSRNANQLTDEGKIRNQAFQYKEKFEKENDMEAIRAALHEDLEAPYDQN